MVRGYSQSADPINKWKATAYWGRSSRDVQTDWKIQDTLLKPDMIVKSRTDSEVELFYRHYVTTPVSEKYLCVVVKISVSGRFIVTAYFTDTIKRGEVIWEKKRR